MSKVKVIIDTKNLERRFADLPKAFKYSLAESLGRQIVGKMLDLIGKGISPIEGNGRFPAYKAVAAAKKLNTRAKNISGGNKYYAKALRKAASAIKQKGYPYNQPDELGKKPRPVNLFLHGDFLKDLIYKVEGIGEKFAIKIFYGSNLSNSKEKGHREGTNGQPSRPTIPLTNKGETFSKTILLDIYSSMRNAVKDFYNS